jgi:hypothetical protein
LTALASTREIVYDSGANAGLSTGIILTTPDTREHCINEISHDTITTTGVGDRQLIGQVIVEYVTDAGRQPVPGGFYPINQTGDLDLTIAYPPVSQWPSLSGGVREIHVDLQIELYENGFKVASLGPWQDWDLFCLKPPEEPRGGAGCTPGYWKQTQHFDSWPAPYTPGTDFDTAFGLPAGTTGNATLLSALHSNGNGNGPGQLMRHGAAALLNAANPNVSYFYSVDGVKQFVQQAFATNEYESLKNLLAAQNEQTCPLA